MLTTRKRMARLVILFFAALTVVAGFTTFWLDQHMQPAYSMAESAKSVTAYIKEHGITPDLNQQLADLPKYKNWVATYVIERQGEHFSGDTDRIVAANPPELVGKLHSELPNYFLMQSLRLGPSGSGENISLAGQGVNINDAAGGKKYMFWIEYIHDAFWIKIWAAIAWVAAGIAWVGLSTWLFFDARERGATAIAGWVLLGLLTGPIALAVWFISRPSRTDAPKPSVCPGCGADTLPDAAHCVRCGYGLKPACHSCRKVVESDWTYCPACGNTLAEE